MKTENIKKTKRQLKKKTPFVTIDFETKSEVDLKVVGGTVYAEHKSTKIIVFGYKFSNLKKVSFLKENDKIPIELKKFKGLIVCHNYKFEYAIISNLYKKTLPAHWHNVKNYRCTAATARRCGLPGALAKVSIALSLKNAKLANIGNTLINKYSKPVADKKTGKKYFREITSDDWKLMLAYNSSDILASEEIYNRLPDLYEDNHEREIFELDKKMNLRGIYVDIISVKKLIGAYEKYYAKAAKTAEKLAGKTDGGALVLSSPLGFKIWLNKHLPSGLVIANCQAFTLSELDKELKTRRQSGKRDLVLKALATRIVIAGAAVKKLYPFQFQLTRDGTLKNTVEYYGAHPGRWAGRGVQPHNFPHVSSENFASDVAKLVTGKVKITEVIDIFKSLLRQLIIPKKGNRFLIGDFTAIEARLVFWVAGCKKALDQYKRGRDLYKEMAAIIYQIPYEKISKKDIQRVVGKEAILGLGYQMGWLKFIATVFKKSDGKVSISEKMSVKIVQLYRTTYPEVKQLWKSIENCFIKSIKFGNAEYKFPGGRILFNFLGNSLKVLLPSGRIQYYFLPGINRENKPYYINPSKGLLEVYGGILVENIIQGLARDLLAFAMLESDRSKILTPVLTVHDEIINEVKIVNAKKGLKEFEKIMSKIPPWAGGLPLGGECEIVSRYCKI